MGASAPAAGSNVLSGVRAGRDVAITHVNVYVGSAAGADHLIRQAADGALEIVGDAGVDATRRAAPGGGNPYKGLEAFDERDANRFFGRGAIIDRLLERYRTALDPDARGATRLLAVVGPSGSGKTSLARAGLVPALVRTPIPGLTDPMIAALRPNVRPLRELALVLARIDSGGAAAARAADDYEEMLRGGGGDERRTDGLRRIADAFAGARNRSLVVLVDQFEELFTLAEDAGDVGVFIDTLLDAASDPSRRVSVIITLRSDFLGATMAHPEFDAALSAAAVIAPAMSAAELREAIAAPALAAGHPIDAATVDLLVAETEGRPGALPLLQFALTRIWDGLVAGREPADTLRAIGGVGGALASVAEDIVAGLSEADRAIARRAFLAMIRLGEGTRDTRRRAPVEELVAAGEDEADVQRVLERFSRPDARLVTRGADGDHATVEVTHEALFEHWSMLREWLEESRQDIRFARRLNEAASKWERSGAAGDLWRPPSLDELAAYASRHAGELTARQLAFHRASQGARRRSLALRLGGFAAVVLAAVSIAFVYYVVGQNRQLDSQRTIADEQRLRAELERARAQRIQSRFLADLSRQQRREGSTTVALGLALEALADGRPVTLDAEGALYEALVDHREETIVPLASDGARLLGLAANGRFALVGDAAGLARAVIDVEAGAAVDAAPLGARAAAHPREPLLAIEREGGRIAIVTLPGMNETAGVTLGPEPVEAMGFSRDGERLYVVTGRGADVISVGDWAVTRHHDARSRVLFADAADARLASVRSDGYLGGVTVLGPGDEAMPADALAQERYLRAVAAGPRGDRVFGADIGGELGVWIRAAPEGSFRALRFQDHFAGRDEPRSALSAWPQGRKIARRVGASPEGNPVVVAAPDGHVTLYTFGEEDDAAGRPAETALWRYVGPDLEAVAASLGERTDSRFSLPEDAARNDPTAFAFSPDGQRLAVGSHVGAIALYEVDSGRGDTRLERVLRPGLRGHVIRDLAFTADGARVVSTGEDGALRSWLMTPRWAPRLVGLQPGGIATSTISADGALAATGGSDGVVRLVDVASGAVTELPGGHQSWVYSVQFIDGDTRLVSGSEDGRAIVWDLEAGVAEQTVDTGHWATRVAPDGERMVRIGELGEVVLLSRSGQVEQTIEAPADEERYGLAFVGDMPITLRFAGHGRVRAFDVIDLRSGEVAVNAALPDDIPGTFDDHWQAAFTAGQVAVPVSGGIIALFDLATGAMAGTLTGHPGHRIRSLAFDPTGAFLASIGSDARLILWDVPARSKAAALPVPTSQGATVSLSAAAKVIVAGFGSVSTTGMSRTLVWHRPGSLHALRSAAREATPRGLSDEERKRFFLTAEAGD